MNFKKIYIRLTFVSAILATVISSCIKADNYPAPSETIRGTIYDSVTGKPLQLDNNEGRIELLELSWTATKPTLNPFFYANDSGYYNNSRIFKGYYNVNVNGPFVPLNHKSWPAPNTDTTDTSPNLTIDGGVTTQNFTVAPILEIQWVTEPVFNSSDSSITATIMISRGTANPYYQKPIKSINFYACEVPYPGDGNYDNRYSAIKTSFPANETVVINGVSQPNVFAFDKPYVVKTKAKLTPRTWWLRVGANTTVSLPTGAPYNYSSIKSVGIK